ncbi:hypothetical protein RH831_10955 [Halodesulfurarchaeum sp. HSR-GB]|uniref:hypothetical protein n=1 Tax=Halodesulfurarchaeum sp. HSR-GB TaxID=3074077 RepID=UPI002859292C|nr:hypothetical protein [Halodesulfurarchaeum sp. HSR-GB]MDR5657694.1 hypothetical protein [Halodesulfurarchaeum sp. HSR-GB]
MNRRQFLTVGIGVTIIPLAGCSSQEGGQDRTKTPEPTTAEPTPEPIESGEVTSNSADNFVEVKQGETVRIEVTEEEKSGAGGTLVRLYDPDNEQIFEENVDDEATFTHQADQGGDFRVIVFTGGTASYAIFVETE